MASLKAGWLQQGLGRADAAKGNLERARDLYAALADEFADRPRYRSQLALCWSTLGHCRAHGDEQLRCFREGLRLCEDLVRDHPDEPEFESELARSHHDLGGAAYFQGRQADAEDHYRRALAIRAEIDRRHPNDRDNLASLAQGQVNLSLVLQQQRGRPAECRTARDQAEASLKRLVAADPFDRTSANSLALLRVNWAYVLIADKKEDEALADMAENVKMLTRLFESEPNDSSVRDGLRRSHGMTATVLENQKRYAEEVAHRRRVADLAEPGEEAGDRAYVAWALARAGDHAQAVAEAEAVAGLKGHNLFFHLAQTCSLAATKARGDAALSSADRDGKAEEYAALAVRMLARCKEADQAGGKADWFGRRIRVLVDEYLAPLRDRDDFRRLVNP